jgi:hypothetical protein
MTVTTLDSKKIQLALRLQENIIFMIARSVLNGFTHILLIGRVGNSMIWYLQPNSILYNSQQSCREFLMEGVFVPKMA